MSLQYNVEKGGPAEARSKKDVEKDGHGAVQPHFHKIQINIGF